MDYLVAGIGLALIAAAAYGLALPRKLMDLIAALDSRTRFLLAVAVRVGIGSVLLIAAPLTRLPITIYYLGAAIIGVALVVVMVGPDRLETFFQKWRERPDTTFRFVFLALGGFGAFLAYVAL